jgi:cellulose synthase/poly-beta-1,6-N-acetylglucosamine synthase-like glycosyltransferase
MSAHALVADTSQQERQQAGIAVLTGLARPARAALRPRRARRPRSGRTAQVVVVVPAHNEAVSLPGTIRSLRHQTRPPDLIVVVSDNCSDSTDDLGMLHGARVMTTAENTARKAGALNQALRQLLPELGRDDLVLVMDADSQLAPDWIRCAVAALALDPWVGGVCGTYCGEKEPGLLRQLQRNEFVRASRLVRRRADLWVLSGTGSMFRAPVLREVARERGRSLPGIPGEYYCSSSITEDYEITLALKTLGYRCLCPLGCEATTELMPTWAHLFRQRLRWQSGTLTALRQYGFTRATWTNWVRQVFFYGRYCSQLSCLGIIAGSLISHPGLHMPGWVAGMLLTIYAERVITVRKAGLAGVVIALLLFPEWAYGMFDGLYLFRALAQEFRPGDLSWGHVVRDGTNARNRHGVAAAGRPVLVREAGNG